MLHFITLLIIMYLGRNDTNHERSDFFLRKNTWLAFQFINFHKYNWSQSKNGHMHVHTSPTAFADCLFRWPETQISAHMIYPAVLKARVLRNIQTPLCLHMVARVYVFVKLQDARACVCACVFSRYFTSSFTTTHTPSHQGAKQNNGAGQAIGLAGVSLLSVSLCLCSISLSSLFKIINVVHVLKTMEKPTTVGLRRGKLTQKWQHEKLMTMWIRKTKTKKHTDYMFLFSPCNIQYRLFFLVIEQILVKIPVSVLLISICIKMPPVCIFFYSFFVFFFFLFFLHTLYFEFDLLLLGFWEKKSPWCTLSSFQTHWDTRIHKFSAHPTNLQAVHLGTALTLTHANTNRCNTHSHSPAYESMVHTIKKTKNCLGSMQTLSFVVRWSLIRSYNSYNTMTTCKITHTNTRSMKTTQRYTAGLISFGGID